MKKLQGKPPRLFLDMDGVLVDFDAHMRDLNLPGDVVKKMAGAYLAMKPIAGALGCVRELIDLGFEVWIATKPPTGVSQAYSEKAQWVIDHLPELATRIIITHDKGLLGDADDFLVDDRPHKANCCNFRGEFLHFRPDFSWPEVMQQLRQASTERGLTA